MCYAHKNFKVKIKIIFDDIVVDDISDIDKQ